MVDVKNILSERAKGMKASEIRELLKLTQRPGIISFAGGLPNPEAFPVEATRKIINDLLDDSCEQILQYGATEGITPLREALAAHMRDRGIDVQKENILITHGSQQALDLISKVFLDPGDTIVVGSPTYLGATGAFRAFQADMKSVPVGENGMDMDALDKELEELIRLGHRPKFVYVVPTFQNPSGVTIPAENRKRLLEIASKYDMMIIEDSPYSYLRYEGETMPHIMSMDKEGHVVRLQTFSKILAPGFRIAWIAASEEVINHLVIAKQSSDLCTNPFGQFVAYKYVSEGTLYEHIDYIKDLYNQKRITMLKAMDEYFPKEAKWTKPQGGMFVWVTLPDYVNTRDMFPKALEENVAYVVGDAFFVGDEGYNTMRLNFTHSSEKDIVEGIKRLARVIQHEIDKNGEGEAVEEIITP